MAERTRSCTMGIRLPPPTKTTSSTWLGATFASSNACLSGVRMRSSKSPQKASNCDRSNLVSICFGPSAVAVINGRLIGTTGTPDSSILAFSAASVRRCRDWRSRRKSTPSFSKKSSASQSTILLSKFIPPSCVSPLVERTSNTPSPTSSTDTSNVPPPKSNTKIV